MSGSYTDALLILICSNSAYCCQLLFSMTIWMIFHQCCTDLPDRTHPTQITTGKASTQHIVHIRKDQPFNGKFLFIMLHVRPVQPLTRGGGGGGSDGIQIFKTLPDTQCHLFYFIAMKITLLGLTLSSTQL